MAKKGFIDDILAGLKPEELKGLQVLSDHATVNGIPGVRFIDKMKFSTSMGEPYNTTKKSFLVPDPTETCPEGKKFIPEVMDRFDRVMNLYTNGIRACPVYAGNLKDEVRHEKKVKAGKIRMFSGGPVDCAFVTRKFLLSFVKMLQEHQLLFEAAPGCVAQSLEWEAFREHLTQFGLDQLIAGDYRAFDKSMIAAMIMAAFDVIIAIHKAAGWTDEECLPLYCIAEDTAYAWVQFDGDLIMFFGSNPSGHTLTVIINSLVNALYLRYCWIILNPKHTCSDFKKFVAALTYGDDNSIGVSGKTPWFNHTAIAKVLATIGVTYTMADKEAQSVPFIHIDNISFLKRTWRWDEDVGAYLAPLDEESIRKSLCMTIPSKSISREMQMVQSITGNMNEFFFYGKQRFNEERKYFVDLIYKHGLEAEYQMQMIPSWEDLKERFWRNSHGVSLKRLGGSYIHPSKA
jgi:hypothetical protein